jgi:hypothetical protein
MCARGREGRREENNKALFRIPGALVSKLLLGLLLGLLKGMEVFLSARSYENESLMGLHVITASFLIAHSIPFRPIISARMPKL